MKEPALNVSEVKELMEAFRKSGLSSFAYKQDDFALTLENRREQVVAAAPEAVLVQPVMAAPVEEPAAAPAGNIVTAPIVGTFYKSPAPDKPAFAAVGQAVKKGDVLFIIESMKVMNEVLSDYDGIVAEIYVDDAQGVEYGQPMMRIE